jgi:hypothetical protein
MKVLTAPPAAVNGQTFLNNWSTAAQSPTAATRTYITGSKITLPAGKIAVGTKFHWTFDVTKTAAGTDVSTIDIAVGTAGTTSDTARVSFAKPAGTAAVDCGRFVIDAVVRATGGSCVIAGHMNMTHNGDAIGLATVPIVDVTTVSSSFSVTTATSIGLCITTGAADVYTIQMVTTESWNIGERTDYDCF